MATKSESLFEQAKKVFDAGDRSHKTLEKLEALADEAEGMEGEMIGDLISAFYADGGDPLPSLDDE
jgi:hypothetical protein